MLKAKAMASSLVRLMPSLRGPSDRKRRLYANAINSVITYEDPIWADSIKKNGAIRENFRRLQRSVALQIISAYRTVSHETAAILAGQLPLGILVKELARLYERACTCKEGGIILTARQQIGLRNLERATSVEKCRQTDQKHRVGRCHCEGMFHSLVERLVREKERSRLNLQDHTNDYGTRVL